MPVWITPSPDSSARRGGSQTQLRRQNTQRVVDTLAAGGPTTQAKLARATGLSTGTISNIVKELDAAQRIRTRPVVDSGRRAIEISLREQERVAVGIDVDADSLRVVAARLDHQVLIDAVAPLPRGHSPQATLRAARTLLDGELERVGVAPRSVVGAGVSLPTIVDAAGVPMLDDPHLPGWQGADVTELGAAIFPFPIHAENDANLLALAQVSWGPYSLGTTLLAVLLDHGVGAGIVVDGHVLRGSSGAAGELGHIVVSPLGETCRCGNRGCLSTVCNTDRLLTDVRRARRLVSRPTLGSVVQAAKEREHTTLRVLTELGLTLGQVLGSAASLLDPEVIVLGGPLTAVGAPLLDPVSRGMARAMPAALAARTALTSSQLGPRAECLGAVALIANRVAV